MAGIRSHKDPLSLGLVGLAEALPFITAALYAGHVADRHNRKVRSVVFGGLVTLGVVGVTALKIPRLSDLDGLA